MTKLEMEVLQEATRGAIKPTESRVEAFKALIASKLIKGVGNNKFKATPEGVKAVAEAAGGAEVNLDTPTKKVKAKPAFMSKPKKTNEELDKEYASKYKHYVKGSIGKLAENGETQKRTAMIRCQEKGCTNTRKVFTSDVFQVKKCLPCKKKGSAEKLANLKKNKKAA